MPKLYTTHCPKCEVLYKKLEAAGLQFSVCDDVDQIIALGFQSAPILEIDGQYMNFKQAVDWIREVQAA